MGKGNWERRAELANVRRETARARKAAKNDPNNISRGSVVSRLSKHMADTRSSASYWLWLKVEPEEIVCRAWFLADSCTMKRCKYSHDGDNCAYAMNIDCRASGPPSMSRSLKIKLQDVDPDDIPRLTLATIDDLCVFNADEPELWKSWLSRIDSVSNMLGELDTLVEEDSCQEDKSCSSDDNDSLVEDIEIDCALISDQDLSAFNILLSNSSIASTQYFKRHISLFSSNIWGLLFSYCDDQSLCSFSVMKIMRVIIRSHPVYQFRRKKAISSMASDNIKKKKDEKKHNKQNTRKEQKSKEKKSRRLK